MEYAGPGKCGIWNTNNKFHVYACVTDTGYTCGYHSGAINISGYVLVVRIMSDTYEQFRKVVASTEHYTTVLSANDVMVIYL